MREEKKTRSLLYWYQKKNTATEMVICLEWGRWGCFYMLATAKTVAVNAIRFGRPKWTTIIFFPAILKSWLLCTYTFIVEKKLEHHQMCLDKKEYQRERAANYAQDFRFFSKATKMCDLKKEISRNSFFWWWYIPQYDCCHRQSFENQ